MLNKKLSRNEISALVNKLNKKEYIINQIKSILSEDEKEDILDLKNIDEFSKSYQFPVKLKLLADNAKLFNKEEISNLKNYIFEEKSLTAHTKQMLFDMLSEEYDITKLSQSFINDLLIRFEDKSNDLEPNDLLKQKILKKYILNLNAALINTKEYIVFTQTIENEYQSSKVKMLVL